MNNLPTLRAGDWLNKVPEVTLSFWIIKIMSTTVGETGADYLAVHVGLGTGLTGGIMAMLLGGALLLQLRALFRGELGDVTRRDLVHQFLKRRLYPAVKCR